MQRRLFVTLVALRSSATDFDPDEFVFAITGSTDASVRWESENVLVVRTSKGQIFRQDERWQGVSIRYESPLEPPQ